MEKIIKCGDIEVEKEKFHQHKEAISIKDIDIIKIGISNKVSFGKKGFEYFTGYKGAKKKRVVCIFFPKLTAYKKDFHETKFISFLIKYYELLEKYNEIWEKDKDNLKE